MCIECWEQYSSPKVDSPSVRKLADSIGELYEHAETGGGLHIVVDDWNLEDNILEFCKGQIEERSKSNEELLIARECWELFKQATLPERASALGLVDGLWEPSEKNSENQS